MTEKNTPGADGELHETEGSLRRGWPAVMLTVAMIAAAIYAFSPRSYEGFPPTEVEADALIANSIARQGSRYVLVGERGKILYTDDPSGDWKAASVDKSRGATLTRVQFLDENVVLAVGHSAWIVRSEDGGETWEEIRFNSESADPLLDIAGPIDGQLYAIGSFGQFLVSTDLGKSWNKQGVELVSEPVEEEADEAESASSGDEEFTDVADGAEATEDDDDDYDPFAAFAAGEGVQELAVKHLNGISKVADGSLYMVGERGLINRSTDNGRSWKQMDPIYDGSFYGAVSLPEGGVLVHGMRGNVFVTQDQGKTWQKSDIPVVQGLFGHLVTEDGKVVLVGASNTVLVSTDNGASFKNITDNGPYSLVSILAMPDGDWLIAGEGGVVEQAPNNNKTAKAE